MDGKDGEEGGPIELGKFSKVLEEPRKKFTRGKGRKEERKKQNKRAYLSGKIFTGLFPIIVYLGFLLTDLFLPFVSVRKFL